MITRSLFYCLIALTVSSVANPTILMAQPNNKTEMTVFAAASLTEAFQKIAKNFEAEHNNVSVKFNFGGSQQLVQQIANGASLDVFASANAKQMNLAVKSGRIDSASVMVFARNHLVVIVPKDNPARISSLVDISKANTKIVFADKSVPAGQYALDVLDKCTKNSQFTPAFKEQVVKNVVSYEENVRVVLSKVVLGEADAGIVYSSDIWSDSTHRVHQITIPDSLNVIAEYPVGVAKDAPTGGTAQEFVGYLCSDKGQAVLQSFGFAAIGKLKK